MKFSAAFVTLIAGTAASVVPRAVKDVATLAELDSIIQGNSKVATNFCAVWSSVCQYMGDEFEDLSGRFSNVVFVSVDIDRVGAQAAAQKYNFDAIPTFITFKDGKEFGNRVVGPSPSGLEQQIENLSKS